MRDWLEALKGSKVGQNDGVCWVPAVKMQVPQKVIAGCNNKENEGARGRCDASGLWRSYGGGLLSTKYVLVHLNYGYLT